MLTIIIEIDNVTKPNLIIISCKSVPCISLPAIGIITEPAPHALANKVVNQFVNVPNKDNQ